MSAMTDRRPSAHGVVVVKVGGELLREDRDLDRLARDLATLSGSGVWVLVVHGGGPQASELSLRLGIEPRVIEGRRVTDAAALEVTKLVFAGQVNTDLVAALARHGARPVGLTGVDGRMLRVHRRPPRRIGPGDDAREVDFGFVGDVDGMDPTLPLDLAAGGYLPVICSLAADDGGAILNLNADTVAAAVAVGAGARRLVILTSVAGVYRDYPANTVLVETLDLAGARAMLANGAAQSGMTPKLTACVAALESGVPEAWIAGAGALAAAATGRAGAGTRIAPAGSESAAENLPR
jgi:acetylglutamate kinase